MEKRNYHFQPFIAMDAFAKHKKLINDYLRYYGGSMSDFQRSRENYKTDHDVIKENHRFVWEDEDEEDNSWGKSLAKKYYDKLFKEYCISDLSRYKENKFAMRWRTEKEVMDGKGQFICGGRKCDTQEELQSWEVNFGYVEHDMKKNALVKLRLCSSCSAKLNFHQKRKIAERKRQKTEPEKQRKREKKKKKSKTKKAKRRRKSSSSSDEASGEEKEDDKEVTSSKSVEEEQTTAIWSQPAEQSVEKSREEELEDYLEDLFF
ncbi:protein FRA10AC1-like isoform X2 [Rhopilema esculentum]|uniref:protein FRA10AC1-like isoform X2 n=1 Tax=Rhopilema esculentum TaxID=499914 RepID=UPI0031E34A1F